MELKVSLILPTYNEKENVTRLFFSILGSLENLEEIIVVDDNSPDGTWREVERIIEKNKNVKLFRRFNKRSLATAIKAGISKAKGDIIAWMDTDFSMPPEVLPLMIKEINGYDIVVGSRYVAGGQDARTSVSRVFSSKFINYLAKFLLKTEVSDLTSGFLAVKKEILEKIEISGISGEYCIGFLYQAEKRGFKIKEFPYRCQSRRIGKSKIASGLIISLRNGLIYIGKVVSLKFKKR